MKAIFRNFLQTLKRFKFPSSLNILGLSIAFAAFMVIMMQVRYDRGFDRFYPQADRIYRVEHTENGIVYESALSRPMIDQMRQAPQLDQSTLLLDLKDFGMVYGPFLTIERGGEKIGFKETTALAFPEIADIFDFDLIEGDRQGLELPGRVLLPQSIAHRFFGNEPALERPITFLGDEEPVVMTIGGVYRDLPENTRLDNLIYVLIDRDKMIPGMDNWGSMGYEFYVTMNPGQDMEQLSRTWMEQLAAPLAEWTNTRIENFRFTPLPDMYYLTDTDFDPAPKGNKRATAVLLGIAILIIAIASINFVNFSTSLAPMRIKSINTRKVLGSPASALRNALIGEAIGISLVAFGLAVLWVWMLGKTSFTQFLVAPMDLSVNWPIVMLSLGVALVVGLIAGVYPARYTTSFPPALVLKGSFGMSPQGKKLRTALVGFQFVVSIALIIAAIFMQVQNGFMRSMETGIDNERLALVELTRDVIGSHQTTLRNQLLASSHVKGSPSADLSSVGRILTVCGVSDVRTTVKRSRCR